MLTPYNLKNEISKISSSPWVIVTDFDGTLSSYDSIKYLLENYADSKWKDTQEKIDKGDIDNVQGLEQLLKHLIIDWDDALQIIKDSISLDDYLKPFTELLRKKNIPIIIVSSGLDIIINSLLLKDSEDFNLIVANTFEKKGGVIKVINPYKNYSENFTNTKEALVSQLKNEGSNVIYLGDGVSDIPAAKKADIVFAKKDLKDFFVKNNLEYKDLDSLKSVINFLESTMGKH